MAEALDDRIIGAGDVVDERLGGVGGRHPGDVGDVLHREGDPEERRELVRLDPPDQLVCGTGRVQRALTVDGDEGAQVGVEVVDPAEVALEELDGTGVAPTYGCSLRARVVPDHERASYESSADDRLRGPADTGLSGKRTKLL